MVVMWVTDAGKNTLPTEGIKVRGGLEHAGREVTARMKWGL